MWSRPFGARLRIRNSILDCLDHFSLEGLHIRPHSLRRSGTTDFFKPLPTSLPLPFKDDGRISLLLAFTLKLR
eukprot:2544394-Amphidinium_carterae.1